MRILCAPDSFKDALSAADAADAMARGIAAAAPSIEIDRCPVADGGEGFVEAVRAATGGKTMTTRVTGPLGLPVEAAWAMLPDGGAAIEMAAASGLELVPAAQRNPMLTTTRGTGELIRAALDAGCTRIALGIGGSATTDGGAGMAQALGIRFLDDAGQPITEPIAGGLLQRIAGIDLAGRDPRLRDCPITVACDVTNPLTGPHGAAAVYGPQKGATPEDVQQLDAGLAQLASLLDADANLPGAGAAGGMGFGLIAMLGATLARGIDIVLDAVDFDQRAAQADLCLTGEGRLDGQSLAGKTVLGVAQAARKHGTPTVALVGSLGGDVERTLDAGLSAYRLIGPGLPAEQSIAQCADLLAIAGGEEAKKLLKS